MWLITPQLLSLSLSKVDDMYDMLSAYEQKVPMADQVKHDDMREANAAFVTELQHGKGFIADYKAQQQETLKTNCGNINEELIGLTASLMQGGWGEEREPGRRLPSAIFGYGCDPPTLSPHHTTLFR